MHKEFIPPALLLHLQEGVCSHHRRNRKVSETFSNICRRLPDGPSASSETINTSSSLQALVLLDANHDFNAKEYM